MVVYLLASDFQSQTPDQADLEEWAGTFGLEFPVLADVEGAGMSYESDGGIPSVHLLGPGAEVVVRDGDVGPEDIEAVLPW